MEIFKRKCPEKAGNMKLGNDFEERILNEIERPVVKARHLSLYTRFQPLFKAAAVILPKVPIKRDPAGIIILRPSSA